MGESFARAAVEAGYAVVATGRRVADVERVFASEPDVFTVTLDVTSVGDASAAVDAALDRFGRIDVLVNSAGASFKGFFEEMSLRQLDEQLAANLVGPMNVTRAVLPVMRRQRSGHVVVISSGAGLVGVEYSSVYAASRRGGGLGLGAVG